MTGKSSTPTSPVFDARRGPTTRVPRLIVVASDHGARQAITRTMPGFDFYFASSVDEAEALTRRGIASGFYVF
jgi:hypothetical protein